jgi:cell division protein FtsW
MKLNVVTKLGDADDLERSNGISPSMLLVALVAGVVLFGLTMLYSTSTGIEAGPRYFIKQLIWTAIGTAGAWIIYMIGYEKLVDFSLLFLIGCGIALVAALFFPEINGARRWIRYGGISVQPSEFAKLAVVFFTAGYLTRNQRFLATFKGLLPLGCVCSVILLLIIAGKDLGTTLLLGATVVAMAFVGGVRLRWILPIVFLLPPAIVLWIKNFDPMRWARLTSFLDPEHDPNGYQLWKSLLALGSGGWTGLGFNCSRMKAYYLPEAHTDFILSVVGEELGFISILVVVVCYAAILTLSLWITSKSKDRKGLILGTGASFLIGMQAIINLGVVSGALPTKGMPAPFISYGGSNMIVCLCCVGVILSVGSPRDA